MFKYLTISDDNGFYELSANIYKDKEGYDFVGFAFGENEPRELWDNVDYLRETLYPWLKGEIEDDELYKDIPEEDKEIVLELFEEAFKLGML